MNRLSHLYFFLVLAFMVPVVTLVLVPGIRTSRLTPIPYEKDLDNRTGNFPSMPTNTRGLSIYQREGCAYCHTQVIRTLVSGIDVWKVGWGADQTPYAEHATRPTTQWDYLGTNDALLGWMRNGPDLANVGYRVASKMELYMQLYNSRGVSRFSNMPSFRHLFVLQKIEGQKSDSALPLEGKDVPDFGMEVVPGEEAVALAEYLMSLKRDEPLPSSLKNQMTERQ